VTARAYGWKRDRSDSRDLYLADHVDLPEAVPPRVDLRETGNLADPIFDQGQLGSCTANAIASAVQYVQRARSLTPHITPSRLALYYWERLLEGTTDEDAGAELRDGLKVVAGRPGYVDEAEWLYDVGRFAEAPPAAVLADAARDRVTTYMRVDVDMLAMKQALAAGFPVVVGFDAFSAIERADVERTGVLPMPSPGEQPIGGHAVLLVGYDDSASTWLCRNSWGPDWGQGGYFTMPYAYLASPAYASDFWTISQEIEGGQPAPPPAPAPVPPPPQPPEDVWAWLEAEAASLPQPIQAWVEDLLHWLEAHHGGPARPGA
jgi:C1A family cysteine protease